MCFGVYKSHKPILRVSGFNKWYGLAIPWWFAKKKTCGFHVVMFDCRALRYTTWQGTIGVWLWRYTTLPSWEHLCSQKQTKNQKTSLVRILFKKNHRENQQPKVSPVYGCWLILFFPTFLKGPLSIFNHRWNGCCPPWRPWDFRTWKSKDVAHSPANCYRKPWFLLTQ